MVLPGGDGRAHFQLRLGASVHLYPRPSPQISVPDEPHVCLCQINLNKSGVLSSAHSARSIHLEGCRVPRKTSSPSLLFTERDLGLREAECSWLGYSPKSSFPASRALGQQ